MKILAYFKRRERACPLATWCNSATLPLANPRIPIELMIPSTVPHGQNAPRPQLDELANFPFVDFHITFSPKGIKSPNIPHPQVHIAEHSRQIIHF